MSLRGFPSCSKIPEAFSTAGTAGKRLKAGGLKWKHQCLVWKGCVHCFPHEHQGEWAHHGELMGKISSGLRSWSRTCACIVGKDVSQRKSAFTAPFCGIWLEPLGQGQSCPQLLERHCWECIAAGEQVGSHSESRGRPNESKVSDLQ